MTIETILQELQEIEKSSFDSMNKTLNYDSFAYKVLRYMEKLKKEIKKEEH